jgi:hypothetical protein
MRCYSPKLEITSGVWGPPPLTRVE